MVKTVLFIRNPAAAMKLGPTAQQLSLHDSRASRVYSVLISGVCVCVCVFVWERDERGGGAARDPGGRKGGREGGRERWQRCGLPILGNFLQFTVPPSCSTWYPPHQYRYRKGRSHLLFCLTSKPIKSLGFEFWIWFFAFSVYYFGIVFLLAVWQLCQSCRGCNPAQYRFGLCSGQEVGDGVWPAMATILPRATKLEVSHSQQESLFNAPSPQKGT